MKDTFSDVNLSILNRNPVKLTAAGRQPNIFFNGTARVVLTSGDDEQIDASDPEGGETSGQFQDWNSIGSYNAADISTASNSRYYRSITNGNTGNDPTSSPAEWAEVEFLSVWNSVVVYTLNATVKGSDGLFYKSLIAGNSGNDPTSSPAQWGPTVDAESAIIGKQTMFIPAGAMSARSTSGAAPGSIETATNDVMLQTMDFDAAVDEFAQFSVQMPESWNASTVTARAIWSHPATTTNFGVRFFIQGLALADGDAADTAFGAAVGHAADTGGTTDDIYITEETGAITLSNTPAKSDFVVFQVYRDVSDAGDTLAVDARLHGISLFYTTDAATDA